MDGQTDRVAISISRVSMLTRDKNRENIRNHVSNRDEQSGMKKAIFRQYLPLSRKRLWPQ